MGWSKLTPNRSLNSREIASRLDEAYSCVTNPILIQNYYSLIQRSTFLSLSLQRTLSIGGIIIVSLFDWFGFCSFSTYKMQHIFLFGQILEIIGTVILLPPLACVLCIFPLLI